MFLTTHRARVIAAAARHGVPAMYPYRAFVTDGGLMHYGAKLDVLFGQAAEYADRVLRGAKPGDLPIQFPRAYDLVVNRRTAGALGLEVPATLLAIADEVID